LVQLAAVKRGKPRQGRGALRGQAEADLAAVARPANPFQVPSLFQPVGQPYGAVVVDQQSLGDLSNGGRFLLRRGLDHKHELMLLSFQAFGLSRLFAET